MSWRILSAEIAHETNTFSCRATTQQDFRNRLFLLGEEAVRQRRQANTELAGFLDVAQSHDWTLEHVLSAAAGPSGRVTRETFDWLVEPVVEALARGRHDGVLLALHGAMVSEDFEDGEGEILRRLRAVCGAQLPIAITLDLHANVSQAMCELANIIVSYKTYPHVDMRDTGCRAARLMQVTLQGDIEPQTIRASCPMLEEVNGARTDCGAMLERLRAAREWEQRDDVFAVSINGGFASADISEVGPSVVITAEGDMQQQQRFAEDLVDDIWKRRGEVINEYLDVGATARIASDFDASNGPLVIADYSDNPGAGAYGDATELLRALLDAGIDNACFAPLVDAQAVKILDSWSPGDSGQLLIGGKTDPHFGGEPLALRVELLSRSDGRYTGQGAMIGGLPGNFGASAVIRIDGIEVLLTSIATQVLDLQQFRAFGIEPTEKTVVALKSMQHFRADFEPIAGQVIVCDSGALCTPDYRRLEYRKVPRPIFPLDPELDP